MDGSSDPRRDQPRRHWQVLGAPSRLLRNRARTRGPASFACWGLLIVLVVWDVYLTIDGLDGNTWSEVLRHASARHPVLPWVLGAMTAHLFHHRDELPPRIDSHAASSIMGSITISLVLLGIFDLRLPGSMSAIALFGIVCGYLLWPMQRTKDWRW